MSRLHQNFQEKFFQLFMDENPIELGGSRGISFHELPPPPYIDVQVDEWGDPYFEQPFEIVWIQPNRFTYELDTEHDVLFLTNTMPFSTFMVGRFEYMLLWWIVDWPNSHESFPIVSAALDDPLDFDIETFVDFEPMSFRFYLWGTRDIPLDRIPT